MKRNLIVSFIVAASAMLALAVSSCAKAEPENTQKLEEMAFDAWVEKHVVGKGIEAVKQSNGMWVEFIEDGDQSMQSSRDTVMWLKLDYTATDINRNVFVTRDSTEALRQRTYSPYTYYVPDYVFCSTENFSMFEGQFFALRNDLEKPDGSTMKLSQGSRVRLYVPSYLAYGTNGFSNDAGYGGQYSLGETKIIIEDLTVAELVKDPLKREEQLVADLALGEWGLTEQDTIATHFYVDTVNFMPRADLLAKYPNKEYVAKTDSLNEESSVKIWFVGKFLPSEQYPDGFIFDTNIEEIYTEFYNRRAGENYRVEDKEHTVLDYTPATQEGDYLPAFFKAVPNLRRGQWSRLVFTSAYGYGATGRSSDMQSQADYYNAYMQYMMMNSMMYGGGYGGYGGGYYNNYYDNYYYGGYGGYGGMQDYYNQSASTASATEEEQQITTEVQAYTPLIFEIYIEEGEEEEE